MSRKKQKVLLCKSLGEYQLVKLTSMITTLIVLQIWLFITKYHEASKLAIYSRKHNFRHNNQKWSYHNFFWDFFFAVQVYSITNLESLIFLRILWLISQISLILIILEINQKNPDSSWYPDRQSAVFLTLTPRNISKNQNAGAIFARGISSVGSSSGGQ